MRLVILDRDGVINKDSAHFIKKPQEFQPLAGSLEAIARLTKAGYTVAVATNQSGVGRGLFDLDSLHAIHTKMLRLVRARGGDIATIVYCPHHPEVGCACRKPKPAMLEQIAKKFKCSLEGVFFVGDSRPDVEAARAAGCRPVLVLTGKGAATWRALDTEERRACVAPYVDLSAFVGELLMNREGQVLC